MPLLRFYQIRFDVSRDFNLDAFEPPPGPLPSGISCRALCTPDVATRYCSQERLIYIEPLDYDAEWTGAAGEAFAALSEEERDMLSEWWSVALCDVDRDPDYYTYSNFVTAYQEDGPVSFSCSAYHQDTVECEGPAAPDEVREDAQGNHYV